MAKTPLPDSLEFQETITPEQLLGIIQQRSYELDEDFNRFKVKNKSAEKVREIVNLADVLADHQSEQFHRHNPQYEDSRDKYEEIFKTKLRVVARYVGKVAIYEGRRENEEFSEYLKDEDFTVRVLKAVARHIRRSARYLSDRELVDGVSIFASTPLRALSSTSVHILSPNDLARIIDENGDVDITFIRTISAGRMSRDKASEAIESYKEDITRIEEIFADDPNITPRDIRYALLNYPTDPIDQLKRISAGMEADGKRYRSKKARKIEISQGLDVGSIENDIDGLKADPRFSDHEIPNSVFVSARLEHAKDPEAYLLAYLEQRGWTVEEYRELLSDSYYGSYKPQTIKRTLDRYQYPDGVKRRLRYIRLRRRFQKADDEIIDYASREFDDYAEGAEFLVLHGKNRSIVNNIRRFRDVPDTFKKYACMHENAVEIIDNYLEEFKEESIEIDQTADELKSTMDAYLSDPNINFIGEVKLLRIALADPSTRDEMIRESLMSFEALASRYPNVRHDYRVFVFQNCEDPSLVASIMEIAGPEIVMEHARSNRFGAKFELNKMTRELKSILEDESTSFLSREIAIDLIVHHRKTLLRELDKHKKAFERLREEFPETNTEVLTFAFRHADDPVKFIKVLNRFIIHSPFDPSKNFENAVKVFEDMLQDEDYASLGQPTLLVTALQNPEEAKERLYRLLNVIYADYVDSRHRLPSLPNTIRRYVARYLSGELNID